MESLTTTGGPGINGWVYFLGEVTGEDIKVGSSTGETMRSRLATVNQSQTTNARYVLLAAARGDRKDEEAAKRYFSDERRTDKGRRTEYFARTPRLAEYINWLRQWWWVSVDEDTSRSDLEAVSPDLWMPADDRVLPTLPDDPELLIQPYRDLSGPLAGTAWDWMISPRASIQDYFTPTDLIDAARVAMGGIDLDAASHPIANRTHRIKDYFHINRSAFENDWHGRVWLNPPYGNNAPWFDAIVKYVGDGSVSQLCMLSPVWAFTAEQARPAMRMSAATVLLAPTPKFWGNSDNRTGTNHPHAIVYFGERVDDFLDAFAPHGIPMEFSWRRELAEAAA